MANQYTEEYRRETADYVISTGRQANAVAREIGVNEKTAQRWVMAQRKQLDGGASPELAAANKRIRELEMENEFLKKLWPSSRGTERSRALPVHARGEGPRQRRAPVVQQDRQLPRQRRGGVVLRADLAAREIDVAVGLVDEETVSEILRQDTLTRHRG